MWRQHHNWNWMWRLKLKFRRRMLLNMPSWKRLLLLKLSSFSLSYQMLRWNNRWRRRMWRWKPLKWRWLYWILLNFRRRKVSREADQNFKYLYSSNSSGHCSSLCIWINILCSLAQSNSLNTFRIKPIWTSIRHNCKWSKQIHRLCSLRRIQYFWLCVFTKGSSTQNDFWNRCF